MSAGNNKRKWWWWWQQCRTLLRHCCWCGPWTGFKKKLERHNPTLRIDTLQHCIQCNRIS